MTQSKLFTSKETVKLRCQAWTPILSNINFFFIFALLFIYYQYFFIYLQYLFIYLYFLYICISFYIFVIHFYDICTFYIYL